jgi:hypothetical protein
VSRRVRITIEEAGSRVTLLFEGKVSMDLVSLVVNQLQKSEVADYGDRSTLNSYNIPYETRSKQSLQSKILYILQSNFRYGSFTAKDVKQLYQSYYGESIDIGVVSTYLGRFVMRGLLQRERIGRNWFYKLPTPAMVKA